MSRLLVIGMLQSCSIPAGPAPGNEDQTAHDRAAEREWVADTVAAGMRSGSMHERGDAVRSSGTGAAVRSACTGDPPGSSGHCSTSCPCGANQGDCDGDEECTSALVCMRDTGALFGWDPEVDTCMEQCAIEALGTPDFCSPECPCEHGQGDCDEDGDCSPGNECENDVGASYGFAADVDVCVCEADPSGAACRPDEPPGLPPHEDECANALDDDGDGDIDCMDQDCAEEAACAVAPPLDPTIAVGFHDSVRFLYEGPQAVQIGVDPTVLDPLRVSVLRGRVLGRDGASVDGVRVTVHGNDAYGHTETHAGGVFDLVVNGGVPVTVKYEATGFLPLQRTIDTREMPFRQHHWLPDVVLTARDPVVTEVVPGAAALQVARGSVQDDGDGARQATLMFAPGTQATAVLPDGSEVMLSRMHVRATEYTVGERGPEAMPGTLPPTSGYTYAVELSVDEADALGARSVVFDRPVGFYLENFLDFPVGTTVPLGYYDRAQAAWIAADSGVVLGIVAESGGLAAIDLDGDGAAESDAVLAAAGITAEERAELGALYAPGQTLWRVSIPHFTPWDCNWPFGPPDDAVFPDEDFMDDPDRDVPCSRSGSIIQCERQSLSQLVDVPSTHVTLAYHGDRIRGWDADRELDLQLAGASLPASITGIVVETDIAGQRTTQELAPSSDQRTTVSWDGRDGFGRVMQGVQRARVRLGYAYQGVYNQTSRFGGPGRGPITGSVTRQQVTLWVEATTVLGTWDATPQGLGGFSIASHHAYDPESGTLFLGDGTRRSARNVAPVLTDLGQAPIGGVSGSIAAAADGTIYVASTLGNIFRIPRGGPPQPYGRVGVGAWDIAVGPDGTLYVTDTGQRRVVAIAPGFTNVRVVAGGGQDPFLEPGGAARPATEVALNFPSGLAVAPDGGLYIVDHNDRVLRHVDPSGMLTTIKPAGITSWAPWDVDIGPDGSLYVSQYFGGSGLYRLHPDGRSEVLIRADENITVFGVSVRADGTVLVADAVSRRILRVNGDGTYTALAGGGSRALAAGEISTDVTIPGLRRGGIDAEGKILFSDGFRLYRVDPSVPGISGTDIVVPSRDGGELYVFDQAGRHIETRDALMNFTLLAFEYDAHGRVSTMTDRDGLQTRIERDARGLAEAIVGPYGQRTELGYEDDRLASILDPLQREVTFGYDAAGRLEQMIDARGNEHRYGYDARGRLFTDTGPTGYTQTLVSVAPAEGASSSSNIQITTPLMRATRYQAQRGSDGQRARTMELPWGGQGTVHKYPTHTALTAPDGTSTSFTLGSDPRWHTQAPWTREARVSTPDGQVFVATSERLVSFDDPAYPHHISSFEQRHTVAGRTSTLRYDAATRTVTGQSPTGRQRTVTYDDRGRVVRVDQPGAAPYLVHYDEDGRIERVEGAGARVTSFYYDVNGNLDYRIDPLGRTHDYEYDLAGRLRAKTGPDGERIALDYDEHDNLTRVTPPGRPAHEIRYSGADQAQQYIPPAVAGVDAQVDFHYDADLAPDVADGPDGQQVSFHHDHAGRIESISLARGGYVHTYDPATGHLAQLTSPDAVGLHYDRDGPLLRETRWSIPGAADVIVGLDHDASFRPWKLEIQGESPIEHGYDDDDALFQAGPLTIVRDPETGMPDTTSVGSVETDLDVSQFAEPEHFSATFGGEKLYQATYTRDGLGRITHLDEVVAGQPRSVIYDYDDADRLAYVAEQGQPVRELLYDSNGNLEEIREAGIPVLTATHDAQDRIDTHGRFALTHTDSGHLGSKADTLTGESSTYQYDEFGNLLGVELADGRSIQYLVDGADRRVAKLVDGELAWLFAYAGGLPVARLFPDGSVESIYVYGALAHVPDLVIKAGRTYRMIHDHLGSPRLVVDVETGEMAQRLDYDVHGRVLGDTSPDFQPFAFAGGLHDVDTGLVRFGARDYDPELGRWTAKDPSGFAGGDTNLYAYAYGDPVNFVDPNGELAFLVPLAIFALKGALVGAATDAGIELASQLIENGGSIDCVDWGDVASSGIHGGISGGLTGPLGKAVTGVKGLRRAATGGGGLGRGGARLKPDSTAMGAHSTFKRNAQGNITGYAEWQTKPQESKRLRPSKTS